MSNDRAVLISLWDLFKLIFFKYQFKFFFKKITNFSLVSSLNSSSSGIVKNISERSIVENHVYAPACNLLNNLAISGRLPGIWGVY
jgi:hypothetical protein